MDYNELMNESIIFLSLFKDSSFFAFL